MSKEVLLKIRQGNLSFTKVAGVDENLKNFLQRYVALPSPCGGVGACGKCAVTISSEQDVPITQQERDYFDEEELQEGQRLSCMQKVHEGMSVTVPYYSSKMQAAVDTNFDITAERLEIKDGKTLGIAVDIGTTTVAVYLYDLFSGKQLAQTSDMNKQKPFGADVISRIQFSMEHADGTEQLQKAIASQLGSLIRQVFSEQKRSLAELAEVCIAANTTMLHLLVGAETKGIALAPFTPKFVDSQDISANDLGLGLDVDANVHLLPSISSYVGADITAGIISSGLDHSEKPCLLVDIGTNGEMVMGGKTGLLACSTAAGPAFEGASIYHGIGGVAGAISHIDLSHEPCYRTIGGAKPVGICGSGVLDAFAQLYLHGVVDETGRLLDPDEIESEALSKRVVEHDGGLAFVLVEADGKGQKRILFTAKDVREVQLAKAAIRGGMETLLDIQGLSYDELDLLYLAGGFGSFLDVNSAMTAGLLPKEMAGRIFSIGNASGRGAAHVLLQDTMRQRADQVARDCKYVELSNSSLFMDYYVEAMGFPEDEDE